MNFERFIKLFLRSCIIICCFFISIGARSEGRRINVQASGNSFFLDSLFFTNGGKIDTSSIGISVDATNCIDSLLGEQEMPPFPPVGILYAVFTESPCLGNGLKHDVHFGNLMSTTRDTFKMIVQLANQSSSTAAFRWSAALLRDQATSAVMTGGTITVNMLQDSVFQWNPTTLSIQTIRFYVTWKALKRYSVTASAGPNGRISATGTTSVALGDNLTYLITPDSGYVADSVYVDNTMIGAVLQYTFHNILADHTIRCTFGPAPPFSVTQSVVEKWNLISIPLLVDDYSKPVLFPTAISNAFAYFGTYANVQSIIPGYGYWLKFGSDQSINHQGSACLKTTIPVLAGWNLLGSLSVPLAVANIGSEPAGLVASPAFLFNNGYAAADTLMPGKGYWIKVSEDGFLELNAQPGAVVAHPIHIQPFIKPISKLKD